MKTHTSTMTLTCEQIYQIWSTEPELLRIFDLRSEEDFKRHHIPGAQRVPLEALPAEINLLENKLAVLILPELASGTLSDQIGKQENLVIMQDCHRWFESNKPVAGAAIALVNKPLNQSQEGAMNNDIVFIQLFEAESSTYTYIVGDKKSKEAAIIDPVITTVERDLKLIEELGLRLMYVLDTHIHADHITAAGEIRKRTNAKSGVSHEAGVDCVDIPLEDGQELLLGNKKITAIATPGHTNTCMSFYFEGMIFTGDALLIRGSGRTDFQQGSSEKLYHSVHEKIFKLPDDTKVYPGHDYRGQTVSSIEMEKKFNPRLSLSKTLDDFKKIMAELKLENPKKIHEAVPANLACGQIKSSRVMHPQIVDGIPEVTCEEVFKQKNKVRLIDVRGPDEYNNELGHIENAELITLGADLTKFLQLGDRNQEIVFVCRSGGRSGTATAESIRLGYKATINMVGGMIRWNDLNLPTQRS